MYQEVFRKNKVKVLIIPLLITVGFIFFYLNSDMPLWTLMVLIVPFTFATIGLKTKVVVEGDALHYERVFRRDEVNLMDVVQIVTREEVHGPNTRNREVVFVLDERGATLFSFSAKLINGKNKRRFEEALTTINAKIKMS